MKIRNGFVSNSSSSSYVVRIRDTYWDEFCDIVVNSKGFSMKDELLMEIDKEIKDIETHKDTRFSDATSDAGKAVCQMIKEMGAKRLAMLNECKVMLAPERIGNEILVDVALKINGIKRFESNRDVVDLLYNTSMHNSFDEGMTTLLKEIVLLFSFDTKKKVECERESYE